MFVSAPEAAAWIQFPESRMSLEYLFRAVRFQHDFCLLNRVSFRDINLEVNVNFSKTELAELESEWFEFTKPFSAGVDMGLFSEAVVSALGVKLHCYPVVSCVMHQLFIASATYIFHTFLCSCRTVYGAGKCLPRATKEKSVDLLKRDAAFHLRVLHYAPDHAVFPAATIIRLKIRLLESDST